MARKKQAASKREQEDQAELVRGLLKKITELESERDEYKERLRASDSERLRMGSDFFSACRQQLRLIEIVAKLAGVP